MTAVRWEGAWRFSIFLAFLLMRHSTALHGPYTPYRSSDDRYDYVDVAQQQGAINPSDTTRFFTAAEVDEEFWLKQLGEDYKNAIHMQVGGDEHQNGVYNMSENGAAYKVLTEPIYSHSPLIDREIQMIPTHNSINDKDKENGGGGRQKKRNKNGEKSEGKKRQRKLKHERKIERVEKVTENVTEKQQLSEGPDQLAEPRNPALLDQSLSDIEHTDLKRYTKFQHINIKYAPEQQTSTEPQQQLQQQTVEEQMSQNKTITDGPTGKETPVVINLPDTNKAIELETNDAAVMVKMPPVIYHSDPANMTDQHGTGQTTDKQQQQLNTETNAQTNGEQRQVENDNDNGQTKDDVDTKQQTEQQTYTPMTYEQQQLQLQQQQQQQQQQQPQQHFQQHTQYNTENRPYSQPLQYTNYPQQQTTQYTQYPVQIPPTQYQQTTLYNQAPIQQPHQQQYSPTYAASTNYHSSVPLPYYSQGVYPPYTISSPPTPMTNMGNMANLPNVDEPRNTQLRYMLSKPSILTEDATPYGDSDAAAQTAHAVELQATETQPKYNHGSPANRELYQEGL